MQVYVLLSITLFHTKQSIMKQKPEFVKRSYFTFWIKIENNKTSFYA